MYILYVTISETLNRTVGFSEQNQGLARNREPFFVLRSGRDRAEPARRTRASLIHPQRAVEIYVKMSL